jgi:paired amphipathic helix protein Sin3a
VQVAEAVKRHRGTNDRKKAAIELRMIDKGPDYFFNSLIPKEPNHYYHEILQMCEDVVQGNMEMSHLEETLRRYYNKSGWQLYTVDKLLSGLLRYVANILGGDAKDKSVDIANLFFKDRERPDTTRRQEIEYRKQVERMSKDGEVYRISYVSRHALPAYRANKFQTPEDKQCTIRYFPSEDPTFDSDALTDDQLWQYYVASYTMSEATEGVDQHAMSMPYLRRNVAPQSSNIESAYQEVFGNITHFDNQTAFISPDTYKLLLSADYIWWRHGVKARKTYPEETGKPQENEKFREQFVRNTKWMENQSQEYVEGIKADWDRAVKEGFPETTE